MKYGYKLKGYSSFVIMFVIIIILIIIFFNSYVKKESFANANNKWSDDLVGRFIVYQRTINEDKNQFNLDILQKQATPQEAEQLLKTGFWPWSDEIKTQYLEKIWANPMIKVYPDSALNYAMKLYNQQAAKEMLSWNSKEGHFLLYGGDIGVTDGLPFNLNNTVKCSAEDTNSVLKQKIYTGANLWNGYYNIKEKTVENEDISSVFPGFSFVNEPCNPCSVFNDEPDYSCPFKLNIKGDDSITPIWNDLWSLQK